MLEGCVSWPQEFIKNYRQQKIWLGKPLGELLREWAEKYCSQIALIEGERQYSYSEIDKKVDCFAAGLQRMGIKKQDRVIIQLPNSIEFVVACFSLFRLGALPVLTLPAHRRSEISYISKFSKAVAYIIPDVHQGFDYRKLAAEVCDHVSEIKHVIVAGESDDYVKFNDIYTTPEAVHITNINSYDVALFLLSGGTTGMPKLIPRTHDDYEYNIRITAEIAQLDSKSVYLTVLPIAHNFALGCPGILGTLSLGGKVVLVNNASPEEIFPIIEQKKITHTALVPPLALLWIEAMETYKNDLSSLRLVQVGGSKFKATHANKFQSKLPGRLQQSFGMSEGFLSQTRINDSVNVVTTTQGCPISPHDQILIVDDIDQSVEQGLIGHLLVRGPYTIRGYYQAEEYNSQVFNSEGYFRTGDLARLDANGYLIIEGRANEVINRGGEKIPTEEVENYLLTYPKILDIAVVAMPDAVMGERACAFVIPRDESLTLREINSFLREQGLADYKLLDRLKILHEFPRTNLGKVNKAALRKSFGELMVK